MTDTETRLRDYFQSQADTIPDSEEGPGLEEPHSSRHWPALLAAAAAVVVLALTVTLLVRPFSSDDELSPAAPPGPLTNEPLKIPYIVKQGNVSVLHDGDRQVRVPSGVDTAIRGRAADGWLTSTTPTQTSDPSEPSKFEAGLLQADGTFRTFGVPRSELPRVSPDGKQVAITLTFQGKIVVLDVRTGKPKALGNVDPDASVMGWNKDGIWYTVNNGQTPLKLFVWKPGSSKPRQVDVPGFAGTVSVAPTLHTVAVTTRIGKEECMKAGSLHDGKFVVQQEYCVRAAKPLDATISPDGRTMINEWQSLAVDIASGKVTKLQYTDPAPGYPQAVFENAAHLIVPISHIGKGGVGGSNQVVRCDVTTGACKLVIKDASRVTIGTP